MSPKGMSRARVGGRGIGYVVAGALLCAGTIAAHAGAASARAVDAAGRTAGKARAARTVPVPSTGGKPAAAPRQAPVDTDRPVPFGVSTASAPTVARLDCATRCGAAGVVRTGSILRVRGRAMSRGDAVVFLGADGDADDVTALTTVRRATSVDVEVPLGAAPGPVAVVDRDRRSSDPSPTSVAVDASPVNGTGPAPAVESAVRSPYAYFGAARPATLTYVVHAPAPVSAAIELVRLSDGVVIARWNVPQVAPELPQTLTWDGTAGGAVQRDGRYAFRVTLAGSTAVPEPVQFEFSRDRFPILGPVAFGTGAAGFGGGRNHQGEDVFAACGTPLVAARGGVVRHAAFQSSAGNYLVIDNDGAGTDYAYMHLREPALVADGDRVATGQPIGYVGDTGDASGCHLHFESWTAPGWYAGGRAVDPLPALRAWFRRG